jgi:hypothetical protein
MVQIITSELVYVLVITLLIIISQVLYYFIQKNKLKNERFKNFTGYMGILNFHLDKAFDIIYKDRIFIYSVEATKPSEDQYSSISRDFATLVLRMLGPNLKKEFVEIYGDEDTLFFNILEYFSTRYESDEIRDEAINNLTQNEIEVP